MARADFWGISLTVPASFAGTAWIAPAICNPHPHPHPQSRQQPRTATRTLRNPTTAPALRAPHYASQGLARCRISGHELWPGYIMGKLDRGYSRRSIYIIQTLPRLFTSRLKSGRRQRGRETNLSVELELGRKAADGLNALGVVYLHTSTAFCIRTQAQRWDGAIPHMEWIK